MAIMDDQEIDCTPNWSELSEDLLCIVLSRLPLHNCWRCKSVCRTWGSAVDVYFSSTAHLCRPPLLLLSRGKDDPDHCLRVFCPEDGTLCGPKNMHAKFSESKIIGCSFGWLIMMHTYLPWYLFNPFTLDQIELPLLNGSPRKRGICLDLATAVLSCNPSHGNNFSVIAILGSTRDPSQQLELLNFGDSEWAWPGETGEPGDDFKGHMLFHNNRLYILCNDKDIVEVWEMNVNKELARKVQIKLETSDEFYWRHHYITHLFEFHGEIFILRRHWQNYENIDLYMLDQQTLTWNIPLESLLDELVLFIDASRVFAVSKNNVPEFCIEGAVLYEDRKKYVCRRNLDPESDDIILEWPWKKPNHPDESRLPLWIVPNLMRVRYIA